MDHVGIDVHKVASRLSFDKIPSAAKSLICRRCSGENLAR
jgi:hypothetical protein